jgi:hypothetical protein
MTSDGGEAYPSASTAARVAGAHWVTCRRAPLAAPTDEPRASWTLPEGKCITVTLANEIVEINHGDTAR